jgi:hypothetical protein
LQLRYELTEAIDTIIGSSAAVEQLVNLGLLVVVILDVILDGRLEVSALESLEGAVKAEPRVLRLGAGDKEHLALTVVGAAATGLAAKATTTFAAT